MQYELRYQVIEQKRQAFQYLVDRFGDRPASRYEEATIDIQPTENFHYRPTWAPGRELYDEAYSALRLSDPYRFLDPRQYYYAPYVTARAAHHEAFGRTLAYLEERHLLDRLPEPWATTLASVVIPLRHYESGAQLLSVAGARFAYGTSIEQCATFAAFDRIGNAQMLSRIGISLGQGPELLARGKEAWLEAAHLQPLRRMVEELLVEDDWAVGILAADLVDSLVYPLLFSVLDEEALSDGAGAYSLLARHLWEWYGDQRRWLDALLGVWADDPEHGGANVAALGDLHRRWMPRAAEATEALTGAIETHLPAVKALDRLSGLRDETTGRWRAAGALQEGAR